jgi:hypothetical protein
MPTRTPLILATGALIAAMGLFTIQLAHSVDQARDQSMTQKERIQKRIQDIRERMSDINTSQATDHSTSSAFAGSSASASASSSSGSDEKEGECRAESSSSSYARSGDKVESDRDHDSVVSKDGGCRADSSSKARAGSGGDDDDVRARSDADAQADN